MTLLGQHGQPQDYRRGVELIRLSAETADENAPQGAYVSYLDQRSLPVSDSYPRYTVCYRLESYRKSLYQISSYQ